MITSGLCATSLSFGYERSKDAAPVVNDVSAVIPRGAIVGILGPNGSGKTTLLRLLAGLQEPWSGHVALDGVALPVLGRAAVARRVAVVPQETQLAFDYSVLEMALMGRYPHLTTFEVEGPDDLAIARRALDATGTLHLEARPFNTLSGGEKQRVVIAAALAQFGSAETHQDRTEVLLLDEPTASLDLAYQLEIRSILLELNRARNLTIVVSTHDLNMAAGLCRDLILLERGSVLATGPVAAMLAPALIQRLYDVDVDITTHPRTGHLTVVPIARAERALFDGREAARGEGAPASGATNAGQRGPRV
jgi:ABC-type cobalamin/Fe3+-siderophores transport system ATPase subunit